MLRGGPGGGSRKEGFPWLREQQRLQTKEKQEEALRGAPEDPRPTGGLTRGEVPQDKRGSSLQMGGRCGDRGPGWGWDTSASSRQEGPPILQRFVGPEPSPSVAGGLEHLETLALSP